MDENGEFIETGTARKTAYKDICKRETPVENEFNWKKNTVDYNCVATPKPIDFVYDLDSDSYNIGGLETDADLVTLVQKGVSDKHIWRVRDDGYIDVNELFRLTVPIEVT